MSENTQDEFAEISAEKPGQEASFVDKRTSQMDQPADGEPEKTSEESPFIEEVTPQEHQPANAEPEKSLPPEAQGETNGGPLGCCLGTMIGLLLSLSLAIFSRAYATSLGSILQGNYWLLGLIVRILMGILAFALAMVFGYLGWKLGKRFYREYDPPVQKRRVRVKKVHQRAN